MSHFHPPDASRQRNPARKRPRDAQSTATDRATATFDFDNTMCQSTASSSASSGSNQIEQIETLPPNRAGVTRTASMTPTRRFSRSNASQPGGMRSTLLATSTTTTTSSISSSSTFKRCTTLCGFSCFHRQRPTRYSRKERRRMALMVALGLILVASLLRYPSLHAQMKRATDDFVVYTLSGGSTITKTTTPATTTTASTLGGTRSGSVGGGGTGAVKKSPSLSKLSAAQLATLQQRYRRRRNRVAPPATTIRSSLQPVSYDGVIPKHDKDDTSAASWKSVDSICGGGDTSSPSKHWSSSAPLNRDSKVVITNVLSEVGVKLALRLYNDCGVEHVLGIDSLMPNHKYTRMRLLHEFYSVLKRTIPVFEKLVVSVVGLQPLGKQTLLKTLQSFQPTHIVHLPVAHVEEAHSDHDHSDDDESPTARLFHRYERLASLSHLLDALVQLKTTKRRQPHVVTFLPDHHVVHEHHVLTSTHHALHGLSMTTLQLEPGHVVYGGVDDGATHLRESIKYALGLIDNTTVSLADASSDNTLYLHEDDLVDALVAGMQWKQEFAFVSSFTIGTSGGPAVNRTVLQDEVDRLVGGVKRDGAPPAMEVGKQDSAKRSLRGNADTTTQQRRSSSAQDVSITSEWLGWEASVSPAIGSQRMAASHLSRAFPYGNEIVESRPKFRKVLFGNETMSHLTSRPFPCASECGYQHQCTSSVYDDRVVESARKTTKGCKYLTYMVDLSSSTGALPQSATWSGTASDDMLCNVAFVSAESVLARRVAKKAGADTVVALSGLSKASGWTLLFVPANDSTMTEEELSLPKLSPGKFFSSSVTRAMYVEPDRYPLPSSTVIVETMKLIDSPARGEKRKKIYRSGSTIFRFEPVPPRRARRVALFGGPHEAPEENLPPKTSEVSHYTNRFMQAKGVKTSSELRQQLQFYEQVVAGVQSNLRREFLEIRYDTYPDFPFQWVDSGMLMHDLREEEARLLRCEWYDEHTGWGNHGMEDLSLAYILAKRRILEKHEPCIEDQPEWSAIRTAAIDESESSTRAIDAKYQEAEMFIRIIGRPIVFPSDPPPVATASAAQVDRRERIPSHNPEATNKLERTEDTK